MATGATVEQLDAQVDALLGASAKHRAVLQEAEERVVADPDDAGARLLASVHREMAREYAHDIDEFRTELRQLPLQRRPMFDS